MSLRQFILFLLSASAIAFASASNALLPPQLAEVKDFPSSVAFILVKDLSKCTATKVALRTFITAAHCFDTIDRKGDVSIEQVSNQRITLRVRTRITHLHIHPQYKKNQKAIRSLYQKARSNLADIAVFKIADEIQIPSATLSYDPVRLEQLIIVGGFGAQGKELCYPILHPCSLNMATQKILLVKNLFFYTAPQSGYPHFLTEGDSGGAAYIRNNKSNELEVIGVNSMMTPATAKQALNMVVSQNFRADPPQTASIYVRISELRPWITKTLRELSAKQ